MGDFDRAFNYVIRNEDSTLSGKITTDEGGRTRFGIAEKFHKNLPASFFDLDKNVALAYAKDIYLAEYWMPSKLVEITDWRVAAKLFDTVINLGLVRAIKMAQAAIATVEVDGIMGPHTWTAINGVPPTSFLHALQLSLKNYYVEWASGNSHTPAEVLEQRSKLLPGLLHRAEKLPV